ncbi:MAG: glycosyltransferase family 2 protein [Chloroflexi bacterium]|nr:MAG: glycosyltransferase family 2 protein [Chloroflexota bacterium]
MVIPAYNEEARLPDSLRTVADFAATQPYPVEVIVVNNNSCDQTGEIITTYTEEFPFMRRIDESTQGKGAAVRTGMLAARGAYRFICDADLSMPIEEVNTFIPPQTDGYDIAIGSREACGAVRFNEPWYRHLMGRVFNTIVRWFAVPGLQDTQCGFKMFRAEVAENLFPLQTMNGWSFDVEILYAARRWGYSIVEVPIHWYYKSNTRIHPIRDSIDMFVEVLKIRRNGLRGRYQRPKAL